MKKIIYTIALFCLVLTQTSNAQNDFNFYNFKNVGQTVNLNPGIMPQSNFTLGFGTYLSYENKGLTPADIFGAKTPADSLIPFILHNPNKNLDNIYLNNNTDILYLGFRIKHSYFHFGIQSHLDANIGLSKNILSFLDYNASNVYLNKPIDLSTTKFNINAYSSLNFGIMHEFRRKLTLGFTYKYLIGLANVNFEKFNNNITISDGSGINPRDLTIHSDVTVKTAGFGSLIDLYFNKIDAYTTALKSQNVTYNVDSAAKRMTNDYLNQKSTIDSLQKSVMNNYSRGWALDLGFQYKFSHRFSISGSLLDFGVINWTYSPTTYSVNNSTYTFNGLDSNYYSFTNKNLLKDKIDSILLDTLKKAFVSSESKQSYSTSLNSRFNFGFQYGLDRRNRNIISANFMGIFRNNEFFPIYNVNFTKRFWSIMDVRVGWTSYNGMNNNIGGGLSLNLGPVQTYIFGDNFLALSDYSSLQYFNLRAGVNINFVRNNDKDGDGVPNKKDKCRKVYGEYQFGGCPDTDHDGVEDSKDKCPKVFGPKNTNGCPDKDKDGVANMNDSCVNDSGAIYLNGCPDRDHDSIPDKDDACPDKAGKASLKGCPDRDDDGVTDEKDACPDIAGLVERKGCPDKDGDGVLDAEDVCPEQAGLEKFRGCPDSDKDGIPDISDKCPSEAGTEKTNGCPDTDGDGIIDTEDKCPNEMGPAETNGCPPVADPNVVVLTPEEKKVIQEAFSNLEFETGTSVIKESSYSSLELLAELLVTKPTYRLKINGFTDNVGKPASNLKLSQNRANAIKAFLVHKNVASDRMLAKGFGAKNPIADNKTAEGRQRNRRVEFVIVR